MDSDARPVRIPALEVLSSLKLTVALLAMSMFLVLVGTLAQVDAGIWAVLEQYFRCWIATVDFRIFFPRSWNVGGHFWFPGGWLIGAMLVVNLLVSHIRRIRLEARGQRLLLGSAVLAVGIVLTWITITHVFGWDSSEQKLSPSMRVTFQLLQGAVVSAVLFMGCKMLFGRKAGIVLLHAGIVLLMLSELVTGLAADEGIMTIHEGESSNVVEDNRSVELAVTDTSKPDLDDVVTIPEWMLARGEKISRPELPFDLDLSVSKFMKNAGIREIKSTDRNPATTGSGLQMIALGRAEESGVSTEGRVDQPALYVTFRDKRSGASLGTYLMAVYLSLSGERQSVVVDGKPYDVRLRFRRVYKPYEIFLNDFKFERYTGTNTPKDYSSHVRLIDKELGTDRPVRIWMNNPLRYRGDTLYQSSFDGATETTTMLQVVSNAGWMVPYLGCMIVAVGLLGQFMLHLVGFLRKRRDAT